MITMDELIGSELIGIYPLERAISDGVLLELFKPRWPELTGGKPIVATRAVWSEISQAGLVEIWNEFVAQRSAPSMEGDGLGLYSTAMNSRTVWVIEDAAAFTILYPEDY